MDDDIKCSIEAVDKRIDDMERHFLELRRTDQKNYDKAIEVAYEGVSERMAGFPEEYAKKPDMDGVKGALRKLEVDAIPKDLYEERHSAMSELIARLDRDKMPEGEFQAFVDRYRDDQEKARQQHEDAATERRAVAQGLAESTAAVAKALEVSQQRREGASEGVAATWKQMAVMFSGFGLVMGIIVVGANIAFQ